MHTSILQLMLFITNYLFLCNHCENLSRSHLQWGISSRSATMPSRQPLISLSDMQLKDSFALSLQDERQYIRDDIGEYVDGRVPQ